MTKTRLISIASVLSTTALLPGLALGVDAGGTNIGIQPRLEVGVMSYQYESGSVSDTEFFPSTASTLAGSRSFTQERYKYKDAMPTLGGGLTFFVDKFYIDLSGQKAFNGSDSDSFRYSTNATVESTFNANFSGEPNSDADFDRQEYAASLGYLITNEFSVFGGYKWAKTDFNTKGQGPLSLSTVPALCDNGFCIGNMGGYVDSKVDYDFKYHGPFLGLAYSFNEIKQGFLEGNLKFTFAAAYLDGEVNVKSQSNDFTVTSINGIQVQPRSLGPLPEGISGSGAYESDGHTVGLTFGVNWAGATSVTGLSYLLGFNAYSYRFNADKSENPDINETALQFKAGIAYGF